MESTSSPLSNKQSALIDFSSYSELSYLIPFDVLRSFSIKYVRRGCEQYTINGNSYHIRSGEYLLANYHAEGKLEIQSKQPVLGMCIDLPMYMVSEALASFIRPDTPYPDIDLDGFFCSTHFMENSYKAAYTTTGKLLHKLEQEIKMTENTVAQLSQEMSFALAQALVQDHIPVCVQLQRITSLKQATRKDLLRRLMKGKELMDTDFRSVLEVKTVAQESCLSEFYFYRLFKAVYGISPHQYLIQRRLEYAMKSINKGDRSLTEVAVESGFSGVHAFSKSFRKNIGMPPSAFGKKNANSRHEM